MTNLQSEALERATSGSSVANFAAIYSGFAAKGIAESDIIPRGNVLTFNAWKAKGRSVKKGEHGVKVFTFVECSGTTRDPSNGEERATNYRRPSTTTVFHISQTQPTGERTATRSDQEAADYRTPRRSAWASGHGRYPTADSDCDPGEHAADRWTESHT